MAPQQKGKQGTKGSKQIVEENVETLNFYRNMALGSAGGFLLLTFVFFEFSMLTNVMTVLALGIYFACYQFMVFMARPNLSDTGAIIDAGNDLNMEGGIAEHVKDMIILTSLTLLCSLISNYFWLLLLLAPIRAVWMLWGSVIKPWLSQKNDQPEMDDKKQKKLDKKMRRMR